MSQVVERFHYDEIEDKSIIERVQDVEPIIKANKRALNDFNGYKSETFNKKAVIPTTVIEEWCRVRGIKYREFMANPEIVRQFVNDPDNSAFNRIPGKI